MANINTSLITLEVLQMPPELETSEDITDYYNKHVITETFLINDTSVPYIIRVATANKTKVKSLDPEFLPEADAFEISESIQEILKDKGFAIFNHKFPEGEQKRKGGIDIEILTEELEIIETSVIPSDIKMIPVGN